MSEPSSVLHSLDLDGKRESSTANPTENVPKCPISDPIASADTDGTAAALDPSDPLSPSQHRAIEALLAGQSYGDAAQAAGVDRRTLLRWRRNDPNFIAELGALRTEQWEAAGDQLRALIQPAIASLAKELAYDGYGCMHSHAVLKILRFANVRDIVRVKPKPETSATAKFRNKTIEIETGPESRSADR